MSTADLPPMQLGGAWPWRGRSMHGPPPPHPRFRLRGPPLQANYTEGLLVGYRWYDKHAVAPAFPFGHGLTYGAFSYSGLAVAGRAVSFNVTRTSGATGCCDTPQLYLGFPGASSNPAEPVKVLRAFQKTCDAQQAIVFQVSDADVSRWNATAAQWAVVHGVYSVFVGSSSADIRLTGQMTV